MFQVFIMEDNIARYYDVFSADRQDEKTYFLIYEYRNNEHWKWVDTKDYTPTASY